MKWCYKMCVHFGIKIKGLRNDSNRCSSIKWNNSNNKCKRAKPAAHSSVGSKVLKAILSAKFLWALHLKFRAKPFSYLLCKRQYLPPQSLTWKFIWQKGRLQLRRTKMDHNRHWILKLVRKYSREKKLTITILQHHSQTINKRQL